MRPGRNAPCPCASGKKYKHCCGAPAAAVATAPAPDPKELGLLVGLVNQGRAGEAEVQAAALLHTHPDAGMLWKILGVALVRQGKDAVAALRRTAQLLPQDAEAHGNLGAALAARGAWEEALVSLRRALALQPRNAEALIDAANAERALGRPRAAVPLYQQALQIEPRSREARNNLANAFLELNQCADAVRSYQLALELKPDDAAVLCNLGNALRQLGQLPEAIACSQRALALAPDLSMAHNNLGLCLAGLGRREEAVASYREALRLNPRYVEALNNLGNALRDLGARREALSLYRHAVELEPQRADSLCNLGVALLESRRVEEGTASLRAALVLHPEHTSAHLGLAAALRLQGSFAEAEASCRAVLAREPNSADALALLGELCADRGQFAQAQELLERALALDPDCATAYGSLAAQRRMSKDDTRWLKGAEALLAKPLPLAHQISVRYALGKYFDDVGEYAAAFRSYQEANELSQRLGSGYDRAKLTRSVDQIVRLCDAAFLRQAQPACPSPLPVFIVGMPRSGTTLTEQILASHPAVFGAGEVRFWDGAFATVETQGAAAVRGVAQEYLARVQTRAGAALRVTDKMPANFLYLGLIHAAFPRARIIHMRRHPLDTCVSIYSQNFFNVSPYANDLGNLAHYYGEYLRIMDHWRAVLPAAALLEIPYEELIEDQEGWTRRMLEFIGLPWDAQCLNFHQTERVVITASKWQVRQKIHSASIGRWRNYEEHLAPLRHLAEPSAGAAATAAKARR
jgi:tetratricopeptide (TPR) repeat protein